MKDYKSRILQGMQSKLL